RRADAGSPTREPRAHGHAGSEGRMTKPKRAGTIILIAALCSTGACMGPADALTGGMGIAASGSGAVESGHVAFLVQPNDVAAGSPISPEVKVVALDTLGSVLSRFSGTVRVALGSRASGGSLSGTISAPATAGLAIFDTLVIN